MRTIDAATVRQALPFDRLIAGLREAFTRNEIVVPERHVHAVDSGATAVDEAAAGLAFTSLLMPAWLPGQYYGIKIVNIAPGNAARGLPGLHSAYLLFDSSNGAPLAVIDGDEITTRRTAAASALAASLLAPTAARKLLIVGAGRVAHVLPEAYLAVRPGIDHVAVWARSRIKAEALASEQRSAGIACEAVDDLEAAVREADIVSCATLSTTPLVRGRWLAPNSHLDLIGSFTPQMREADDECIAGAAVYVDTDEALRKSGDLLGPIGAGAFDPAAVRGTLATLCRGESSGRESLRQRTVFKSVGSALEDLVAAILAMQA